MHIRDLLLPALRTKFPDRPFTVGTPPDPIATFPAAHPDVGDLVITDDGAEATVFVGDLTHGHFGPYDQTSSPAQVADRATDEIVDFLALLFADRVLLWSVPGHSGGWRLLTHDGREPPRQANTFLWSGPCDRP